jgi:hypothetical protein
VNVQRIADKTVPRLLSLVFLLCGCGGTGGGSGSSQSAMLRVVNGMWGSGGVNVIVDGATVATGIPYSMCVDGICTVLSGYVTVKSGGVNFAVQQPPAQSNLVPSQFQKLNLEPNTKNTFVLSPMDTAGTNVGGHAIRNSSQAGRTIAEEARSSRTRTRLDSFAGCTRGVACFRSELFEAQEPAHHRPGKFESGVPDLGSNKKHLRNLGR